MVNGSNSSSSARLESLAPPGPLWMLSKMEAMYEPGVRAERSGRGRIDPRSTRSTVNGRSRGGPPSSSLLRSFRWVAMKARRWRKREEASRLRSFSRARLRMLRRGPGILSQFLFLASRSEFEFFET